MNDLRDELYENEQRLTRVRAARDLTDEWIAEEQEHERGFLADDFLLFLDEVEGHALMMRARVSRLIDRRDDLPTADTPNCLEIVTNIDAVVAPVKCGADTTLRTRNCT